LINYVKLPDGGGWCRLKKISCKVPGRDRDSFGLSIVNRMPVATTGMAPVGFLVVATEDRLL